MEGREDREAEILMEGRGGTGEREYQPLCTTDTYNCMWAGQRTQLMCGISSVGQAAVMPGSPKKAKRKVIFCSGVVEEHFTMPLPSGAVVCVHPAREALS
eukprot:6212146-Pleurochrysis_carterae.AAC.5